LQVLSSRNFEFFKELAKLHKNALPLLGVFTKGGASISLALCSKHSFFRKFCRKTQIYKNSSCFFLKSALLLFHLND